MCGVRTLMNNVKAVIDTCLYIMEMTSHLMSIYGFTKMIIFRPSSLQQAVINCFSISLHEFINTVVSVVYMNLSISRSDLITKVTAITKYIIWLLPLSQIVIVCECNLENVSLTELTQLCTFYVGA